MFSVHAPRTPFSLIRNPRFLCLLHEFKLRGLGARAKSIIPIGSGFFWKVPSNGNVIAPNNLKKRFCKVCHLNPAIVMGSNNAGKVPNVS